MQKNIMDWLQGHEHVLQQVATLSLVLLGVTLLVLPIVVAKLPVDYFTSERRNPLSHQSKPSLFWGLASVIKNLLGLLLILAGLILLVLPGQGTVTILIGLALTNFPGKYKLERRIASQPAVLKTLNKIREIAKKPPFVAPEITAATRGA